MSQINVDRIVDSSGGVLAPISSVMRNRLINGAMVLDQRNAGASVTPTVSGYYSCDRFQTALTQASKFSVQQNAGSVTPPVGFVNYLGVTSLSAYTASSVDVFAIFQQIEGFNTADLNWGTANAAAVTLSFWVRSSLTGTFGGSLVNGGQNRSYPFIYTVSSANTWEQKSITIAGDTSGTWLTNNGTGISIRLGIGVGSTLSGTAGAWAASNFWSATGATSVVGTNGATFYITGVQFEVGTQATSFEYRQYQQELALCQRYFVKDLQDSSTATFLIGAVASSTLGNRCGMRFPVTMRTTPTATVGGTANPRIYDGAAAPAVTSIVTNSSSSFGACLELAASGGGLTIGRAAVIIDNNASFITYSAEL
jgi:hypothetical protein